MTVRHERVDTRALLNGHPGDANFTPPKVRLEELERVRAYWPDEILVPIRDGFVSPPPWRLLVDPTAWHDVPPRRVHSYVRERLDRGVWPSLDGLRRAFDRVSNHRRPDEIEGQYSLL